MCESRCDLGGLFTILVFALCYKNYYVCDEVQTYGGENRKHFFKQIPIDYSSECILQPYVILNFLHNFPYG